MENRPSQRIGTSCIVNININNYNQIIVAVNYITFVNLYISQRSPLFAELDGFLNSDGTLSEQVPTNPASGSLHYLSQYPTIFNEATIATEV